MRVTPIAQTTIDWQNVHHLFEGTRFGDEAVGELEVEDPDHLAEFAGRACYKAWERQNPATAQTSGYLANILEKQHFSVLEHASVTFYVEGVSRSLLTELERHRFLSFSVESQRYVDQAESHPEPVVPPAMRGRRTEARLLESWYKKSLEVYQDSYEYLTAIGYGKKKAREAARAYLPNCTPVDFVVTGNLRAWREIIEKRRNPAADAEIQEFADAILKSLREIAPLSVQDIEFSNE